MAFADESADQQIETLAGFTVNTVSALQSTASTASDGDVITLDSGFAADFVTGAASVQLPALSAGTTLTIDGGGAILEGIGKRHFIIASGNAGTYVFENMTLQGGPNASSKGTGGIKITGNAKLKAITIENTKNEPALQSGSSVVVEDCVLQDMGHSAIQSISSVSVINSYFKNINAPVSVTYNHGSAILISNSFTASNSTFDNCGGGNTIVGGYTSGAIGAIGDNKTISIDSCYFVGNEGNRHGGAITLYRAGGTASITNSYFKNNSVTHTDLNSDGGAIGVWNNGIQLEMDIENCTFEGNTAGDDAGAVFFESNTKNSGEAPRSNLRISNSTFFNNKSGRADNSGSGGAVQISLYAGATFTHNTFVQNNAISSSGAYGLGGAVGYHSGFGLPGSWTLQGPNMSFKGNLFVDNNTGSTAGASKQVAWYTSGTKENEGNIGFDASGATAPDPAPSLASALGTSSPALAVNGSGVMVGASLSGLIDQVSLTTILIAPRLNDASDQKSAFADYGADNVTSFTLDQRIKNRGAILDAGSVDIKSAVFDANGGEWTSLSDYSYESPILYAQVTRDPAGTITALDYDVSGGSANIAGVSTDGGGNLAIAPTPSAPTDMVFKEWNTAADGSGTKLDPATDYPEEGVTYYAIWEPTAPVQYDLYYVKNDGGSATQIDTNGPFSAGTAITLPDATTVADTFGWSVAGKRFAGWAESPTGPVVSSFSMPDPLTEDQNLYAIWENVYTVTYAAGGGTGSLPTDANLYASNETVTVASQGSLSKPGWTFAGWLCSQDNVVYQSGQTFNITENVTLTATWNTEPQVTLTYHLNGGMGSPQSVSELYAVGVSAGVKAPSSVNASWGPAANYRFDGWALTADGAVQYQPGDVLQMTQDMALYAKWTFVPTPPTPDPDPEPTPGPTPEPNPQPLPQPGPSTVDPTPAPEAEETVETPEPSAPTTRNPSPSSPSTPEPEESTESTPEKNLEEDQTPLGFFGIGGHWSLVDLILAILGAILAIFMAIKALGRKEKSKREAGEQSANKETTERRARTVFIGRIVGIATGICSVILFILTQDMTQPMQLVDFWTIIMLILAVIQVVALFKTFHKRNIDEEPPAPQNGASFVKPLS